MLSIDEITKRIVESRDNDIAKAFTMHIGSLLINNGIVPIMTEYTGNDVKSITDTNEYKLVMEYGIAFNELDCSKHDKEVYNKAIDEFIYTIQPRMEWDNKFYALAIEHCIKIAEQLKEGRNNENYNKEES